MKKYALVLSGGGFKGAFQVGALKFLKKNWNLIDPNAAEMKFDLIAGVSVGTLNGYLIASEQYELMETLWKQIGENGVEEIYTSDFIDTAAQSERAVVKIDLKKLIGKFLPNLTASLSVWKLLGALFSPRKFFDQLISKAGPELSGNLKNFKSIADYSPLRNKLQNLVKKDAIQQGKFKCGFVSLNDGKYYSFPHDQFTTDEDFQQAMLASAAMPIVWEPVSRINTLNQQVRNAVDGGVRNVSPLADVIDEINRDASGAEYTIIIINCNDGSVKPADFDQANIAQIALRSLTDIALAEIFNNDLKEFLRINDLLEQADTKCPGLTLFNYDFQTRERSEKPLRHFRAIVIQPASDVLGDTLAANKTLIESRMEHGKQKAEQALEQLLQPA